MTDIERLLEVLRLSKPHDISNPDMTMWLGRADQLDAWVLAGAGQSSTEAQREPEPDAPQARTQRQRSRQS